MASLNDIASVFAEYEYDENVGFMKIEGVPCLACVSRLDRDVNCICVAVYAHDVCELCDHYDMKCGSMPAQLLGVAQWYWNFVKALAERDPGGEEAPVARPLLTARRLWRLTIALEACGAAWRELERHLMDPGNFAILTLQELASARKIATLSALQSAGANIDCDEFHDRIAAVQPAYTRDGNCVATLRDALARLSIAEKTVVQSVQEMEIGYLPDGFPSNLRATMRINRDSGAPRPKIVYNGMPASLCQN